MNIKTQLPPEKRTIIPPVGGWVSRRIYIVDVSYGKDNPIHRSLFYSGFLDDKGNPAGYNHLHNVNDDQWTSNVISNAHYLKAVSIIKTDAQDTPEDRPFVSDRDKRCVFTGMILAYQFSGNKEAAEAVIRNNPNMFDRRVFEANGLEFIIKLVTSGINIIK